MEGFREPHPVEGIREPRPVEGFRGPRPVEGEMSLPEILVPMGVKNSSICKIRKENDVFNLRPDWGAVESPSVFSDCQKTAVPRAAVFGTLFIHLFHMCRKSFRPGLLKVRSPCHVK